MDDKSTTTQEDLAFLRDLAERGQRGSITGGSAFLAGGLLYGIQCLYHWLGLRGWIDPPEVVNLLFAAGPTVLFLIVLGVVIWKDRRGGQTGLMGRALNAVFGGIGLANLAMVIVFGVNTARTGDLKVWLLYPAVIFALQGAAWYTAAVLRKRLWLGLVAAGWLVVSVALGLNRDALDVYLLVTVLALFFLMALPGWVLIRLAKRDV